jgi:hypothetical protein
MLSHRRVEPVTILMLNATVPRPSAIFVQLGGGWASEVAEPPGGGLFGRGAVAGQEGRYSVRPGHPGAPSRRRPGAQRLDHSCPGERLLNLFTQTAVGVGASVKS